MVEIDKLIKLFCLASGLQVNVSKTTVLHEGLSELDLIPFKTIFPFTFQIYQLVSNISDIT
jgi:hypothetical protein